ncbi:MAG: phosphoribosylpyrophosphate synthetase [Chitinophagaceae bacterium]
MSDIPNIPEMTTLVECINTLKKEGYTKEYQVKKGKLTDPHDNETFSPDQIAIDNFYRFEGESNPSDSAILYAISTRTDAKGILVDAYGTYSDEATDIFFKTVAQISKKIRE